MGVYKNYKSGDVKNVKAGYTSNAFITPIDHFTTIQQPVISATPEAGETVTIGTSHVYAATKGSIAVYCVPKSIEAPAEMTGELMAKGLLWKPKIIIAGDGPELQELVEKLITDSFLLHIEDADKCKTGGGFIQFGSKCTPAVVSAGNFASGTQGEGRKQWEIECEATERYFYNGSITEQA